MSFFGNSETETEERIFELLDRAPEIMRVPQSDLEGNVFHLVSGESLRPDGLIVFPNETIFRCLANRIFALEIKPDSVVRDHLKMISELTEQARSYVDSRYEMWGRRIDVDGCIVYPNLEQVLKSMEPNVEWSRESRTEDFKAGVVAIHRRVMARQRIFELVPGDSGGFEIFCASERLCRFNGNWKVTGKNHKFLRKIGSSYR